MMRKALPYLALSAFSVLVYLAASGLVYRTGFPLDDAWIHQTYARSLGRFGEWAYLPGQPSAGSTSPVWSGLLAIGHALGLGPYLWTYLAGWLTLAGTAALGGLLSRSLQPASGRWALAAGLLLALEWHLVWAAVSGMETLLQAFIALLVLAWLVRGWGRPLALGILIGFSVWVRPDGLTLLGPALLVLSAAGIKVFQAQKLSNDKNALWKSLAASAGPVLKLACGFLLPFVPYLIFNYILNGDPWPNTFYAKQAEYAASLAAPFSRRLLRLGLLPLVGVGALLAPGFFLLTWRAAKRREWAILGGAAWAVGYLLLYVLRLPVAYQHGRYLIPIMPVFFIWGAAGMQGWLKLRSAAFWPRVFSRAWMLATGAVLAAFWGLGAWHYANDVAFIESEMVETAHWVAANTLPDELVAAHDIGALGYFGERRLLDLAGLISPEVIPFIRDEERLASYLSQQNSAYLVTFPGWYRYLDRDQELIFSTHAPFAPRQGGENMAIFRWRPADLTRQE
jgi:hypothetical protein